MDIPFMAKPTKINTTYYVRIPKQYINNGLVDPNAILHIRIKEQQKLNKSKPSPENYADVFYPGLCLIHDHPLIKVYVKKDVLGTPMT